MKKIFLVSILVVLFNTSYSQNNEGFFGEKFSITELSDWTDNFKEVPQQLSLQEKNNFIQKYNNIILASDAFFPFRDSIDKASKIGTKYVVQPGGSIGDESVIKACEQYNMIMVNTNIRLFHH